MRLAWLTAALIVIAGSATAASPRSHHRAHHRRPVARHPLHLSADMSSATTASAGFQAPRAFADDRQAFSVHDRLGGGATATFGLQSRVGGPVMDRSEMNSAAASGRQPSSQLVGVGIKRPF